MKTIKKIKVSTLINLIGLIVVTLGSILIIFSVNYIELNGYSNDNGETVVSIQLLGEYEILTKFSIIKFRWGMGLAIVGFAMQILGIIIDELNPELKIKDFIK